MAFVEIENLIFSYPESKECALTGVNLAVEQGEICLVIGKSGSGKSTLLRLLKKEIAPSGKLSGNVDIKTKNIGFVNQNVESNIIMDSVQAELAFAPQNAGKNNKEISLKIAEAASYFNLGRIVDEKTSNLSGGTKQIVSLASVFTAKTDLLLLDEPVSQLDPVAAEEFINIISKLNRDNGTTVLITSHRIENILPIADKIAVMDKGKIIFCGSANDTAKFLIQNNHDMKAALPQYTLVFKENPIDFSKARNCVHDLKYKHIQNMQTNDIGVRVKGICFTYEKGLPDVLYCLDYKAEQGKINAIVGANGSGKTTLLKCIAKIQKYYGGKVKAKGKTAYMPQNVQLLFTKDTVFEEIADEAILKQFDLLDLAQRNPFDLSGGEAQRLALAKIVATDCDILLLDEPTKSVDAPFADEFAKMLKALAAAGKTIIIVTHNLEFAGRYADNVAFLFDKKIVAADNAKSFFSSLDVYTTSISKLTCGKAVSVDDIEVEM